PVRTTIPANDLSFPYNQRFLMRGWNLLFLPEAREGPAPDSSDKQSRGAYLVEALGHCGECHTPRNRLFALDQSRKFAGTVTNGWKAYNLTSDAKYGLGEWSDDEIASYLQRGYAH